MTNPHFEQWLVARQRRRGYGAQLTDAEMVAGLRRSGELDSCWEVWQAARAGAAVSKQLAEQVMVLNPTAGQIGEGRCRQLQSLAIRVLASP